MMNHDRLVELAGEIRFIWRTEVAAPLKLLFERALLESFIQNLHRFVVVQTRKRRYDRC